MAPIKFEEQIKDKLEKRSLQPSAESWAKLTERLEADEKKSKNPRFLWMGIAAAVVITLTIVMQVFTGNEVQEILPQVVEQGSGEVEKPKEVDTETYELVSEDNETKSSSAAEKVNKNESQIIKYKTVTKSSTKATQLAQEQKIKETTKTDAIKKSLNEQKAIVQEAIIDKVVVEQAIKDLNVEKTRVTDREVDSLLKVASKELFKDKLQDDARRTVDANSLLQEVEDEMGESFRTKVYEVLKDGYKTVKTAVAQRND